MKILIINSGFEYGSTGRICFDLTNYLEDNGHTVKVVYGRGVTKDSRAIKISSNLDVYYHFIQTRVFDRHGLESKKATYNLLKWIDNYNPDIIHLHNLHGYYINYEILFQYIKKKNKFVIWTLHDCWSFTGHCSHFSTLGCDKWTKICDNCPQKQDYPSSYIFDRSKKNFLQKKNAFTGVKNMILVTPSKWLSELVRKSFLKDYPVKVINNGIDLDIFKFTPSNFKKEYNIENKRIILGVANIWTSYKGLNDFIELSKMIDDSWKIVLVGVDEKQRCSLPGNILAIGRTDSIRELAEIYSAADVFVNPSKQETMGLVTVEAIACGTPVIAYDLTAIPEMVGSGCGYVVKPYPKEIYLKLNRLHKDKEKSVLWARNFDKHLAYEKYLKLYGMNGSVFKNS